MGLLGNPSDGYGGKAIAFSLADFHARVEISPHEHFRLCPGPSDLLAFDSLHEAGARFANVGCEDGLRLMRAAILRFLQHHPELARLPGDDPRMRFELGYETDIPRQVGLSGSSAIVTATLRALSRWFERPIEPATAAELALAAELRDLGIACGPMDRVIQAYEGVVYMDLAEPRSAASYRRLDPALLPPLFVAWDPRGGEASSRAHGDLRARWEGGDTEVRSVMERLRNLVDEGLAHLEAEEHERFAALVRENFALRSRVYHIGERDRRMVELAEQAGHAAKLCGSGGAIVGVLPEAGPPRALVEAYRAEGFDVLTPEIRSAAGETT